MKIGPIAENMLERIGLFAGLAPTPFLDTVPTVGLAQTVMVATKLGIFESLANGGLSAFDVAKSCGTHPNGTEKLLKALIGTGYIRSHIGFYELTRLSRKFMLKNSPHTLYTHTLFLFVVQRWVEHYETFVRTGTPIEMHDVLKDEDWQLYQGAMRELATLSAPEVARRVPIPRRAHRMLDIGGSHGYYSVLMCRKHAELQATVFDLPEAIRYAAPLLLKENMRDRVVHKAGNALTDDLGTGLYDFIYVGNLLHHFGEESCKGLIKKIAAALRPGGVFTAFELLRKDSSKGAGQIEILADLYFAVTSQSGTWSSDEIVGWQTDAGLVPLRPRRLLTSPGFGLLSARKP